MGWGGHAGMHACMHMHKHKHIPSNMSDGTHEEFEKVMEGHGWSERSWSWPWSWSWTWACPCPYPWNRHTHMHVQTQRQALACKFKFQPGFCFEASHSQIRVRNKLIIKDSSTPTTVMKIDIKVVCDINFSYLNIISLKKKFQRPHQGGYRG